MQGTWEEEERLEERKEEKYEGRRERMRRRGRKEETLGEGMLRKN